MSDSNTHYKVYKYRLYPSTKQETNLFRVLDAARNLYNMTLAERKFSYDIEKRRVGVKETYELAKCYRSTFPYAQQLYSQSAQIVVKQVDNAYQRFFKRVKSGEKPGYPRFKSKNRFNSFEFPQFGKFGAFLDGRRLKLFGIGRVRVRWHRPIEGTIKTVRIVHKAGDWYACFVCEVEPPDRLTETGKMVGVDVGISSLITTSDGDKTDNPQWYRDGQADLRRKQRKLARAKRGSKNRRKALLAVQKQHEHVMNQRRDFLNKLAHDLVKEYDIIALENLQITNMARNKHLSKSILDSGWGYFKQRMIVKAESAGRELIFVDPAYTSKTCSSCGTIFEDLTLADRRVTCECGLSLDRDHNAAINILNKAGLDESVSRNVIPLSGSLEEPDKDMRAAEPPLGERHVVVYEALSETNIV